MSGAAELRRNRRKDGRALEPLNCHSAATSKKKFPLRGCVKAWRHVEDTLPVGVRWASR